MLKDMLEKAIGRKLDKETFKLVADMTTKDIKFHNIDLVPKMTKKNYVINKLVESISVAENAMKNYLKEDIKKDSLPTA